MLPKWDKDCFIPTPFASFQVSSSGITRTLLVIWFLRLANSNWKPMVMSLCCLGHFKLVACHLRSPFKSRPFSHTVGRTLETFDKTFIVVVRSFVRWFVDVHSQVLDLKLSLRIKIILCCRPNEWMNNIMLTTCADMWSTWNRQMVNKFIRFIGQIESHAAPQRATLVSDFDSY